MIPKIFYSIIAIVLCGIALYCIWMRNFNFFQWVVDKKLWIATVILIAIVVVSSCRYRSNLKHLLLFVFSPNNFVELCVENSIQSEMETNESFKKKIESDEDYKKNHLENSRKDYTGRTKILRNTIFRSFVMVLLVFICAVLSAFIMANFITITGKCLLLIQIVSAFFILWALMGKLGLSIQTYSGTTLPEQINNFWFIFLNVIGIYFLFFTYFFSLFKQS